MFDYRPVSEAQPSAAEVTFAVVGASFPRTIDLFRRFGENMKADFFEMLSARGYGVRGPFGSYDEVTFPDKKGSDLLLEPEVHLDGDDSGMEWTQSFGVALLGGTAFKGKGTLVIQGRVNLVVSESLSHERMWTKSVEITPITVSVAATDLYASPIPVQLLLEKEAAIYRDVAQALEVQYKAVLERSYQYLDPEEMRLVKKQAAEIRAKKVY